MKKKTKIVPVHSTGLWLKRGCLRLLCQIHNFSGWSGLFPLWLSVAMFITWCLVIDWINHVSQVTFFLLFLDKVVKLICGGSVINGAFLLNRVLFLYLCFHPDISKNVPKMVLFLLYQGVWGLQHTFKSALQPLVFKHFIDIRCYVTNVAYFYAYCFN